MLSILGHSIYNGLPLVRTHPSPTRNRQYAIYQFLNQKRQSKLLHAFNAWSNTVHVTEWGSQSCTVVLLPRYRHFSPTLIDNSSEHVPYLYYFDLRIRKSLGSTQSAKPPPSTQKAEPSHRSLCVHSKWRTPCLQRVGATHMMSIHHDDLTSCSTRMPTSSAFSKNANLLARKKDKVVSHFLYLQSTCS